MNVLALNRGSSSLKFGLYRVAPGHSEMLLAGEAESAARIARLLSDRHHPAPDAIGHRIVHGGPRLLRHQRINAAVLQALEAAAAFAPLHMPAALSLIRFAQAQFPALPQVACLDTVFHAGLPALARTLPLPRAMQRDGIRRYGFHGLACESVLAQLGPTPPARLVIAHLGSGASVTAVLHGVSVDTSMGLTPSGGLVMGTRSGDIDPGLLIHLMRSQQLDAAALEDLLQRRSGLLGISGLASDMRSLHLAAPTHADAGLAIDMFCQAVCKQIAGMVCVLDGVDCIVFSGGIGEHDAAVRATVCRGLACIGVALDGALNSDLDNRGPGANRRRIDAAGSRCEIQVMAAREEQQIAHHVHALCTA